MPSERPSLGESHLRHAVVVTGLQRSYPEISRNIYHALSTLYGAARRGAETTTNPLQLRRGWSLNRSVGFFGVRPANDSWHDVRLGLPPLRAEAIQTPCGYARPTWFSAYAKTSHQRWVYGVSFVQMLCDLQAALEPGKKGARLRCGGGADTFRGASLC